MKNLRIILIIFVALIFSYQKGSAQQVNCPQNFEKAKQDLKEYLSSKKNIANLKQEYKLALNDTTFKTIYSLSGEKNTNICSKLLKNAPWLKNFTQYSFYKTENYYFIVTYSFPNNTYKRIAIDILDQKYKRKVAVMDF